MPCHAHDSEVEGRNNMAKGVEDNAVEGVDENANAKREDRCFKPLMSLCIMFHNQCAFAREVLRGAFSQNYEPLEIVISDDASTDGTSDIVRNLITEYRASGGRHAIVYERNETALGMLGNREHVYSLAHGELLINADGDDIPFPNRVDELANAWLASDKKATILSCEALMVDVNGHFLGMTKLNGHAMGAVAAMKASALKHYKPVCRDAAYHAHDDLVYATRMLLLGPSLHVSKPLLLYRYGSGESTGGLFRKKMVRGHVGMIAGLKQGLEDLESVKSIVGVERFFETRSKLEKQLAFSESVLPLWMASDFKIRIRTFVRTRYASYGFKACVVGIFLLFPHSVGNLLFLFFSRCKLLSCRIMHSLADVKIYSPYVEKCKGKVVVK